MLDINQTFESGIELEVNHDYGFVRFLIDPTAVVVRKYPIIVHGVVANDDNTNTPTSTLWFNNLDMIAAGGFDCKLHQPYSVSDISFEAPSEGIATKVLSNVTIPYTSYLTYEITTGEFVICKREEKKDEEEDEEETTGLTILKTFSVNDNNFAVNNNTQIEYVDYYTKEQGSTTFEYVVGYRASNSEPWLLVSEQKNVCLDFEDILLTGVDETDADKTKLLTLRLRFNPQVSSFKNTIQEEKIDTIGSKYPFFVRNGTIGYKEIPLGGLITYHMDDLHMFFDNTTKASYFPEELTRPAAEVEHTFKEITPAVDFYLERQFKQRVERWLNNGKPKVLRTAAEGNFIVRLMNISFSPMEQLSRKLHSFTATAYECADYTQLESYFTQLATPAEVYVPTENEDEQVDTNYTFTSLPQTLYASEGQYITKEAVAQMELSTISFTLGEESLCLYNKTRISTSTESNLLSNKHNNFGIIQGTASANIQGTRKLSYLSAEVGG